jgi:hypothetical protein
MVSTIFWLLFWGGEGKPEENSDTALGNSCRICKSFLISKKQAKSYLFFLIREHEYNKAIGACTESFD